jgi:trimethylamine-N-oxide reductase (cytochrome c)
MSEPIPRALFRRDLLGGLTAVSAAALLAPREPFAATSPVKLVADGEVVNGSHFGVCVAKVEGGRMVKVRAHETDLMPADQITTMADWAYSEARIKYPMVRKDFLKNAAKSDRTERGKGEFVRVSWDQALDLVASELKRVKESYGNKSIFAGSYGWKTPGLLHNCFNNMNRMMNLHGGFVDDVQTYSTGAIRVILPYVFGGSIYDTSTWPTIVKNTELLVFWGSNPAVCSRIGWNVPNHGGLKYLQEYKKAGKAAIVIDPCRTATADLLDAQWIAPRPGTDVAMMLGIAYTLMAEGLHDKAFLADYCEGFEEFSQYLAGKTDGKPKTAEWASEICGIDVAVLKDLARTMAKNRTMISMGWSIQRQDHGEQGPWMCFTLACLLGQIGLPGGGASFALHYANYGTPRSTSPVFPGFPAGDPAKDLPPPIPVSRVPWVMGNAGKEYDYNGKRYTAPDLRLIYWVGGNPMHHHQDRNLHIKFWQAPETIIVHDINWTQTARFADIVLPICSHFEHNDISTIGEENIGLVAMKQVIAPLYESRSDFEVCGEISKRLGFAEAYSEKRDEMGWLRWIYEEGMKDAAKKGLKIPDFETFWNKEPVLNFPTDKQHESFVQFADFRDDPLLNPLPTPSGKFEIFSRQIEKYNYDDCPPHPTWIEPAERLGGAMADKYPLHVTTAHPGDRLHSQFDNAELRHRYEIKGREPVMIHPKDAQERGIADGEVVRIFNGRGQILAGAVVTDMVRPSVVRMCEGAWYDPAEPGVRGALCKHGDVNVLTLDKGTSKLAQGNCAHTVLAQIEKFTGPLPEVTAFKPYDG